MKLLDDNKNESKTYWESVNSLFKPKDSSKKFHLVDQVSKTQIAPEETADYINDFFVNIGPKLARDYTRPWKPPSNTVPLTFELLPVEVNTVSKVAKDLNSSKASAIENISSPVLKEAFLHTPNQFTHIINLSLTTGKVPEKWKVATVVPLPKEGDPENVSNLRPISTLPLPGKVLERIVYNSTVNYLDEVNLVTEHQSGFRSGHSTISAIADFTDDIYRAINNSNITHTVFIDFSKAFDTINHEILLKKLFHLGFKKSSINWFQNYLTNRKQKIIANNKFSDLKDIVCGVPQGSILGPLLFLLYVNDLGDCLQYTKYKLYADDTVLYLSTPLRYNYDELLNKDLLNMHNWCQENKLTVNLKKTKYMATASSSKKLKKLREAKITMGGVELQKTTEFKYLGITIDNCLNFNKHVSVLNQTVSHKIYLLNKIRWFIKEEDSINIYKTMILPHLPYGDVIYSATSKGNLKKLQKIQNRGIRTCI